MSRPVSVTDDVIEKARELRSQGKGLRDIAEQLKISYGTVQSVTRGVEKERKDREKDPHLPERTIREEKFSKTTHSEADDLQKTKLELEKLKTEIARQDIEDQLNQKSQQRELDLDSKRMSLQERRVALINISKTQGLDTQPVPGHNGVNSEITALREAIEKMKEDNHRAEIDRVTAQMLAMEERVQRQLKEANGSKNVYGLLEKISDKADKIIENFPTKGDVREMGLTLMTKIGPAPVIVGHSPAENAERLRKAADAIEAAAKRENAEREVAAAVFPGPDPDYKCFGHITLDLLTDGTHAIQAQCRACERLQDCQINSPMFTLPQTAAPGGRGEVNYGKENK